MLVYFLDSSISFFDTEQSESDYSLGSTSVQVLSPIGMVLLEEPAGSRLSGFALAFDRLAKITRIQS